MQNEILNIVYYYSFNYKLPDKEFFMSIINIILKYHKLNDYIVDINFNYDGIAVYKYISKILSFSIPSIIEKSDEVFNKITFGNDDNHKYERIMFICFNAIKTIFHEFEHIRQAKVVNNNFESSFEKELINNCFKCLALNYCVYQKEHDIFPIERLAILKSGLGVLDIMSLDTEIPSYIENNFYTNYNYFMELYYRNGTYPLLKYVQKTRTSIYYDDILISRNNAKKILKKSNKDMATLDRLLYGLPITKDEYMNILEKSIK